MLVVSGGFTIFFTFKFFFIANGKVSQKQVVEIAKNKTFVKDRLFANFSSALIKK